MPVIVLDRKGNVVREYPSKKSQGSEAPAPVAAPKPKPKKKATKKRWGRKKKEGEK